MRKGTQANFCRSTKLRWRQLGYTLGELLISMSVVSILAAVAIPGMQDVMLNNRRVSVTNELSYALHMARSEAITRNQRVTVCATSNGVSCASTKYWSSGWIVFNDLDLDRQTGADGETVILKADGNESTTIKPIGIAGTITYRPSGRVMGDSVNVNSAQFVFCDTRGADHARVLIIGTNGRPRMSATLADGSGPSCS
jgi:type IV fimbrial biogenesis protein FimT